MKPWAVARKALSYYGSTNDKGENEMIPEGCATDLLTFSSQLRKISENLSYRTINKGLASNEVPLPQIRMLGSHSMSGTSSLQEKVLIMC